MRKELQITNYKEISFNSFKNKITNKLFNHKLYVYNHLTVCKMMSSGSFKNVLKNVLTNHIFLIYV